MIKTIIISLNSAFTCRLVSETWMIALMQAGTLANQLANAINHAGNITKFAKNHASKSLFFSQDS